MPILTRRLRCRQSALIVLSTMSILSACDTVELVRYVHSPSAEFYRGFDISSDALSAFTVDDVVFVVDVKQVDHSNYTFWLGLYSAEAGKTVTVNAASLSGVDQYESRPISAMVSVDAYESEHRLYRSSVKLFDISGEDLTSASSRSGSVSLDISFDVVGAAESMQFILVRDVEKQSVFLSNV